MNLIPIPESFTTLFWPKSNLIQPVRAGQVGTYEEYSFSAQNDFNFECEKPEILRAIKITIPLQNEHDMTKYFVIIT